MKLRSIARNAFVREAPALGAAISITIDGVALLAGASALTQGVIHGITAAWLGWYVRSVTTPKAVAQERLKEATSAARDEVVAYLASLPKPAPRTRKKP